MVRRAEEAKTAAGALDGPMWFVKAQIHAGGRGKGTFKETDAGSQGGVRLTKSVEEAAEEFEDLLEWQEATRDHDEEVFGGTTGSQQGSTVVPAEAGSVTTTAPTAAPTVASQQRPHQFPGEGGNINVVPTWAPSLAPHGGNFPTSGVPSDSITPKNATTGAAPLAAYLILLALPLLLICCCWRFCCRSKSATDTKGEYRAVAAQYGNMGYDNTFSEVYSDDEDDMDLEDDSWGKSGRRTLEMSNLGNGNDDKLSMSEMNG